MFRAIVSSAARRVASLATGRTIPAARAFARPVMALSLPAIRQQGSRTFGALAFGVGMVATTTTLTAGQAWAADDKAKKHDKLPDNLTIIFVLGGPGAGKGTQCARLVSEYNFVHLSAGDLLRAERERPGSKVGDLINSYIVEGKIVPMEITIGLLRTAMLESGATRFLIDGFPRAMDQAQAFEREVAKASFVLFFDCPEGEMERRLLKRGESSGRVDDNIDSIRKRFRTYQETTMPVIKHYESQGHLRTLWCNKPVEEVYGDVKKVITQELKLK